MKTQDIRESFIKYFEKNNHKFHQSSSLIPHNDPTLLFANAGMNQFKEYFTGNEKPKNKRAVTIQKCVRAGGKHNDLENVGQTARHHTFFEMLGNFSFGDYFKQEAINFAWEFLTKELKIDKNKLYVTVHDSDKEARDIWHKEQGIPLDRIFFRGDKDNFWEMGETGPCGPCSEIFYDHGEEYSDGSDTSKCILDDESRYVEIWNLVFMQYEKFIDNGEVKRKKLPKPSVDTGAGLERLAACIQNKYWNYDIDAFELIIKKIEKISKKSYTDPKYTTPIRVLCDHIRSSVMLITDGIIPSNEGRGYVLRRIIRRAIRFLDQLGVNDNSFHLLIPEVIQTLGKQYPENAKGQELADKLIRLEEEKFRKTLKIGLDLIKKEIKKTKSDTFSGKTAFKLYDTYGFPIDLTEVILDESSLSLDKVEFDKEMQKQVKLSQDSANFKADDTLKNLFYDAKQIVGETDFCGYEQTEIDSTVLKIISYKDKNYIICKKTPFYPEGGGQVGDKGTINDIEVLDTQSPIPNFIVHICNQNNKLKEGSKVKLKINNNLRELSKRNHTATHLLQAAMIKVLGSHIKQAGSKVTPESLRFDFTHTEPLSIEQISKIEDLVNNKIKDSITAQAEFMSKDEADKKGATALFGEKYGEKVRVLSIDDFSIELCGGIHVDNTSEINIFVIKAEGSLASGVRRLEALTSAGAIEYLKERSEQLKSIETQFSAKGAVLLTKVVENQKSIKEKNKEINSLKEQLQSLKSEDLFNDFTPLDNGLKLHSVNLKDGNPKDFKNLSDSFVEKFPDNILLLYSSDEKKTSILLRCHKKNKRINCSTLFKNNIEILNGRGGGRPDMAQGSGDTKNLPIFIEKITSDLQVL